MSIFLLLTIMLAIYGCSYGRIKEHYEITPVEAKSASEGKVKQTFTYRGKKYMIRLGKDGSFYAVPLGDKKSAVAANARDILTEGEK